MKQSIICITGGHLTPALAVIEEIRRRSIPWQIMFIGRRQAFEGGGSQTHEERLVNGLGVPFHALMTGRSTGLFKMLIGFFQALYWFLTRRPAVVLSFGGYVALPVAIAAWILGIPVVTHEQTEGLGMTNQIIALFARQVIRASQWGVPLRRGLFSPPRRPSFSVDVSHPILYITGGSTGAQSLNALVFPLVSELTRTWTVIHQVGAADRKKAGTISNQYVVAEYFDVSDLSWIYHHAVFVIGRAGANTAAEVAAIGVPALFVPLPWSAADEQSKNATKLERMGMAVVLDQKTLTADALLASIVHTMRTIPRYKKAAEAVAQHYPRDGAKKIVDVLQRICS